MTYPTYLPLVQKERTTMARNRLPRGKGWFIWILKDTVNGDPKALAYNAKQAGVGHLVFHIHNGYQSELQVSGGMDLTNHIREAEALGIECWGWGAVYKSTWSQGADRVIEAFKKYPTLVGYLLDAEAPIKGAPAEATALMKKLRTYLPNIPIGLSSYRYPRYHPDLPWKEFRSQCDFDIPQVYWEQCFGDTCGSVQLKGSYTEFQGMLPKLPYCATAPAYKVNSWFVSSTQIQGFFAEAKTLGITAVNFWVWYHTELNLPVLFKYIQAYPYGDVVIPPPPDPLTLEEKVDKLWEIHPEIH